MTLKTLPENLTTMVENFTDSTPLGDLLSAAITLAQYRVVGYDTFAGATKLRGLITPHTLVAETAQKAGIGLKQCATAGASDGAGVFDELRAMNEADFATWLGSTDRKQTLAGALETAVTVLASPGFAAALVNEYSAVSAAIGETPATVTARGDDLEALRRIAVAYNGFSAGHDYYDDPASAWAGLNAVATAAKNQQAIGDPASMGEAYAQTAQALHALLSDAVLIKTVASNQVTMSAWVNQPAIMSAVWDSQVAAAEFVTNPVAFGELVEPAAGGGVRVGFTLLLSSEIGVQSLAESSTAMQAVAESGTAMTAVAASSTAMQAVAASATSRSAIETSTNAYTALSASPLVQTLELNNPANGTFRTFAAGKNYYVVTFRQNYYDSSSSSSSFDSPVSNAFNGAIDVYGLTSYYKQAKVNRFTNDGIRWHHSGYVANAFAGYFRCIPC